MPEQPNRAANFQGGSSDYWDGLLTAYHLNQIEMSLINDGMTVEYGGGGEAAPPQAPHFMQDVHAAGAMVMAGEVING